MAPSLPFGPSAVRLSRRTRTSPPHPAQADSTSAAPAAPPRRKLVRSSILVPMSGIGRSPGPSQLDLPRLPALAPTETLAVGLPGRPCPPVRCRHVAGTGHQVSPKGRSCPTHSGLKSGWSRSRIAYLRRYSMAAAPDSGRLRTLSRISSRIWRVICAWRRAPASLWPTASAALSEARETQNRYSSSRSSESADITDTHARITALLGRRRDSDPSLHPGSLPRPALWSRGQGGPFHRPRLSAERLTPSRATGNARAICGPLPTLEGAPNHLLRPGLWRVCCRDRLAQAA